MSDTRLHEQLAQRIVESIEIAEDLRGSDPCSLTVEAVGLLRRAYSCTTDRAAALRVIGRVDRHPAEKPGPSEILRGIQAARAKQPRRRLLGILGRRARP